MGWGPGNWHDVKESPNTELHAANVGTQQMSWTHDVLSEMWDNPSALPRVCDCATQPSFYFAAWNDTMNAAGAFRRCCDADWCSCTTSLDLCFMLAVSCEHKCFCFFLIQNLLLCITAHINVFFCRFLSQCVALGCTVICSHSEDLIGVLMKADLPGGLWGSGRATLLS